MSNPSYIWRPQLPGLLAAFPLFFMPRLLLRAVVNPSINSLLIPFVVCGGFDFISILWTPIEVRRWLPFAVGRGRRHGWVHYSKFRCCWFSIIFIDSSYNVLRPWQPFFELTLAPELHLVFPSPTLAYHVCVVFPLFMVRLTESTWLVFGMTAYWKTLPPPFSRTTS